MTVKMREYAFCGFASGRHCGCVSIIAHKSVMLLFTFSGSVLLRAMRTGAALQTSMQLSAVGLHLHCRFSRQTRHAIQMSMYTMTTSTLLLWSAPCMHSLPIIANLH